MNTDGHGFLQEKTEETERKMKWPREGAENGQKDFGQEN
jgi:hypothetical protein